MRFWAICIALFALQILILAWLANDNSMETCLQSHSHDTCAYTLR